MTVDGRPQAKSHLATPGEHVRVQVAQPAAAAAQDAAVPFAIVWQDEYLLVVDKPAGLVVHPARGHARGTLAQALAPRRPAATIPSGPASCTAWTATRRG